MVRNVPARALQAHLVFTESGCESDRLESELGKIPKRQACHDIRMGKWLGDSYANSKSDCVGEANAAAHCKMGVMAETRWFSVGFAE